MRSFVRVLIKNENNQVLIVSHRGRGQSGWNLPGGKVEQGEPPETAARREVMEETGLMLHTITLIDTEYFQFESEKWKGYFFVAEPLEQEAYNMEPKKLSKVMFADESDVLSNGIKAFFTNVIDLNSTSDEGGPHWQKQIDF